VAWAQAKNPMSGLSPAALTLGHPHTSRLDFQTLLSIPSRPSKLPSQPFFSFTKGIQPIGLVPAAQALRSEAQVGDCVTICIRTGSSEFRKVGKTTSSQPGAVSEDNSPVPHRSCGGTSWPLAWSQMGAAGRILAPPDSSPRGWGLQEAGREVLHRPPGRCLRKVAHPLPEGKCAWGADRTRMGSAEWEFQKVLGPTSSFARGTWLLACDAAAVSGWTGGKVTNRPRSAWLMASAGSTGNHPTSMCSSCSPGEMALGRAEVGQQAPSTSGCAGDTALAILGMGPRGPSAPHP